MPNMEEVLDVLRKVNDPEHPVSVLDLDIVTENDIEIADDTVKVQFAPTVPFCPMGGAIGIIIKHALEKELDIEAEVSVKPGSHVQEELLNQTLNNPDRYQEALGKLRNSGLIDQCIQS